MLNRNNRRSYILYYRSLLNDYALDKLHYNDFGFGLKPNSSAYIPRPDVWIKQYGKLLKYYIYGDGIVRFLFAFIIAPIYFATQAILLFKINKNKEYSGLIYKPKYTGAVLLFSSLTCKLYDNIDVGSLPSLWISFPWVKKIPISREVHAVSAADMISSIEVLTALVKSIYFTFLTYINPKTRRLVLAAYTAFRFQVVNSVLQRLPGPYYISVHTDRWAVLSDQIMMNRRIAANDRRKNTLSQNWICLVQHGICDHSVLGESCTRLEYGLHYRLKSVEKLFVYNQQEEAFFYDQIFSRSIRKNLLEVRYFDAPLNLRLLDSTDLPKVLFVGHSLCLSLHLALWGELIKSVNFIAYYKTHPADKNSYEGINHAKWLVIDDSEVFPVVDLVISYPSTLVYQYRSKNIPVIVHEMFDSIERLETLICDVKKAIYVSTSDSGFCE